MISPAAAQHIQTALGLVNAGRVMEAVQILTALVQADPTLAPAHSLLGQVKAGQGDLQGAEASLREAVRLARKDFHALSALGQVLAAKGQAAEAEKALRGALALERRQPATVLALAELLAGQGRLPEALQATTPMAVGAGADAAVLQRHGETLRALGRYDEALPFYERAVAAEPASAVTQHNLAAALGDAERDAAAADAARRAFAKGGDAPETWLVLARAELALGRYDEAEAAFRQAIRRRPAYGDAHAELTHLLWMRTADLGRALETVEQAIAAQPAEHGLAIIRARMLEAAGDEKGAYEAIHALAGRPGAPVELIGVAAVLAVAQDPRQAIAYAEEVLRRTPEEPSIRQVLCAARLAAGDADEAARLAQALVEAAPDNQLNLAYQATAWRLLGDERYRQLYDYEAFVRPYVIDTPDGWGSLEAYLADLSESLIRLHGLETHPVGQSLRGGSQTSQSLRKLDDPAIKGFFQAIDGPIRRHMEAVGKGKDPVRRRNRGRYDIAGIWSVRLKPNGFHINHVHPQGWFSSACYITIPAAVDAGGKEGWIKFGEPGTPTTPPLEAEHYVRPEPGLLVLFPSYMWHGTVPFTSPDRRMTVAFDVVPR